MAEDDIYGSKGRFENMRNNLEKLCIPPEDRLLKKGKYFCKNKENLAYFEKIFRSFDAKDTSFIRRLRLSKTLLFITHFTEKNLKDVERDDVEIIFGEMHRVCKSPKSKSDFVKDIKFIWKIILPELDKFGRPDETLVPYVVRHLSAKIDKSREKMRNDKFTLEEFENILNFHAEDLSFQAFVTLSLEAIGRPQETLYRKVGDVELNDSYAQINLSDHGKEGVGILQCIDSYPNLIKWLDVHPFKNDKNAYLFLNNFNDQLTPDAVNKKLKKACKALGINKNITCYSIKRNGVTFRRLKGESDMDIQHAARWTSTKQLKTYDMSTQQDAFKQQLIKKGIISADKESLKKYQPENKKCMYCETLNISTAMVCSNCKRILDRKKLAELEGLKDDEIKKLTIEIDDLKKQIEKRKPYEEMMNQFFQKKEAQDMFEGFFKETKKAEGGE